MKRSGLLLGLCIGTVLMAGCQSPLNNWTVSAEQAGAVEAKPTETVAVEPEIRMRISAVGDLMCHEPQYSAAKTADGYDFTESLREVKGLFEGSGLVIGNLETAMAGPEKTYSEFPCFNTPDAFADALKDCGFNVLTTANNHTLDRRFYGVKRTLDVLDGLGIRHTGSFRTGEEDRVLVGEYEGFRIGFVGYTYGTNGIGFDKGKEFSVNLLTEEALRAGIADARSRGVDLIVVSMHFGQEYQLQPNDQQKKLVAAALEEGADIVLGTHPHVVQGQFLKPVTDRYGVSKRRFVAYSLGNFLSSQRDRYRDAGVIARLEVVKKDGVAQVESVSFVPTWVDQSYGAGARNIRVLPVEAVLQNPSGYELLTAKDLTKVKRAWDDVNSALALQ